MKKLILPALLVSFVFMGYAQDVHPEKENVSKSKKEYTPHVDDHYPQEVYFGDTHLHTSWSTDAGMIGGVLGPDEGYRVSRGETVTSKLGWKVKLIRPLDFLVIADHAENLGLADFIRRSDPILLANPMGKKWHDMVKEGKGYDAFLEWLRSEDGDLINEPRMMEKAWSSVVSNADKYYEPGKFTTFHGFEWTSMPEGNNLHRVVIFRDGADRTSQIQPFSQYDSFDPEDLWDYLETYETKTDGQVLALAHNGNFSNGLMFDDKTYTGGAITKEYVETRARWEPLYEVTQGKGDMETHPVVSPDDEFADFETTDKGNLKGKIAKTPEMLPKEYARPALKAGLAWEEKLGTNPFKFGMVGSTDAHTALPTTREDNWYGKAPHIEPEPERTSHVGIAAPKPELSLMVKDMSASGLAAVWARENTRESIWDAMKRKEVYATSGTRLRVRVFGGWDFKADEVSRPDFAREGYKRGVPMGGDLSNAPRGKAPNFMIRALRDPDGANIDRIQVVKGWLDSKGKQHERVYDVAVSGDRTIGKDGRCPEPVGNTVNVADASFTNDIGAPVMTAYWEDPNFDANESAFYYVRVIEIPTPRWTAYDAKFFGVAPPEGTKMQLQDRAYTSPIWYTPK